MRSVGLKTRGGIGIGCLVIVETEAIAGAGSCRGDQTAEVTIGLALEPMIGITDDDADRAMAGSPNANVGTGRSQFSADGALPREHREEHNCKQRATYV